MLPQVILKFKSLKMQFPPFERQATLINVDNDKWWHHFDMPVYTIDYNCLPVNRMLLKPTPKIFGITYTQLMLTAFSLPPPPCEQPAPLHVKVTHQLIEKPSARTFCVQDLVCNFQLRF